jgi:predicted enzyme related to lactoylglutathione lyase
MSAGVSAVLFAKDARKVAQFYVEVFGAVMRDSGEHHAMLDCQGFELMVQQIPAHLARDVNVTVPPQRRERGSVRLDYPVADIASARKRAKRLGGQIDELPPPWAGGDASWHLGYDPEGNVFCAKSG